MPRPQGDMHQDDQGELGQSLVQEIEAIFKLPNREIWVVTAAAGERSGGLVATWVMQASIDPKFPLVLAGIAPNHFTADLIQGSRAFAAHLIRPDQIGLVERFAGSSGRHDDKMAGVETRVARTGSPILADVLAWLDCRVLTHYDAGTRLLFCAAVIDGKREGEGEPMRERDLFSHAHPELLKKLKTDREADTKALRPLHLDWLESLGS